MKKRTLFMFTILIMSILFDCLASISSTFSDYYTIHFFPFLTGIYGRFTSLFPFSVGEILLSFGLCWLITLVLFTFLLFSNTLFMQIRRTADASSYRHYYVLRHIGSVIYRATAWLLTIVFALMSLNCFVLYHCTPITDSTSDYDISSYSEAQLASVRDYIVACANALSVQLPRDSAGNLVYNGNMQQTAIRSMQKLGVINPRLAGFYVTPKPLAFSDFMSQQFMQGYYFPFSMEANYNNVMYISNKPFTMCHELAHTHGYIYEDEANLIGYLACIGSDDLFFRYSGYLGLLNYVNNDYYKSVSRSEYASHIAINSLVKKDNRFLTDASWKQVEKKAVIKTETVKAAANTFIDTNLKANGVKTGKISYTHVVNLLLDYYYDEGNSDVLQVQAS